jgi:hypothetical protein
VSDHESLPRRIIPFQEAGRRFHCPFAEQRKWRVIRDRVEASIAMDKAALWL